MRCRSRRTSTSARVQSTWSHSSGKSCGPFTATAAASNVPAGADVTFIVSFTDSPDPRGLPLGSSTPLVSGRFDATTARRRPLPGDALPVAFRLTGVRFSGHPAPAGGFGLPHGRPTGKALAGPHRGCHVPHAIDTTGVGVLCAPGTAVRSRPALSLRPAPAASQRPAPCLPPAATHRRKWL